MPARPCRRRGAGVGCASAAGRWRAVSSVRFGGSRCAPGRSSASLARVPPFAVALARSARRARRALYPFTMLVERAGGRSASRSACSTNRRGPRSALDARGWRPRVLAAGARARHGGASSCTAAAAVGVGAPARRAVVRGRQTCVPRGQPGAPAHCACCSCWRRPRCGRSWCFAATCGRVARATLAACAWRDGRTALRSASCTCSIPAPTSVSTRIVIAGGSRASALCASGRGACRPCGWRTWRGTGSWRRCFTSR